MFVAIWGCECHGHILRDDRGILTHDQQWYLAEAPFI